MESIRGYRIKGRKGMSHWSCLMEEWMLAIERYTRITGGEDAPYYYNERANISVLAGAAWRAGWVALEEFQSEKGYKNKAKTCILLTKLRKNCWKLNSNGCVWVQKIYLAW